ncbi:MAG TPA: 4Fe-4S cluster-binding domain-containing protein [Smithellaceae bacterium]|nr:4Fe-4S cluster-binding domain-containing protein [Smithellaceae bacterium]HPE07470.1 4Fe-4S cluster-binding domain-containing protein [Smithellaceae bacterium]HRY38265.1 4Fe-4S cluster-binding domain-containing protein [Smithellaceae bacterium]
MQTVSALLDKDWHDRYRRIARLNIRSSIYDLTNRCNLRCKGCFFFSSGEHHVTEETAIEKWEQFIDQEKARGVNLAILIGGEPTLCMDRLAAFYKRLPTYCATNGLIKVPRDQFPDMMVGISLWGGGEDEKVLRGQDTFAISSKNYEGDPYTYYLYTVTPRQVGRIEPVIRRIADVGLKVHLQLLSNDESVDGFYWRQDELDDLRLEMDAMLDRYPQTVISSKYYHEVITTGMMLGRRFGWQECPSVTESLDTRKPPTRRLIHFYRWAADLHTVHRCCTSATRDCSTCKDGAAHMSWIMVNKRAHMNTTRDFQNWIEVYEMFAKLYRLIPW